MKSLLTFSLAALLAGCATIDNAGFDQYTVKATPNGYELDVKSGKEYGDRGVQFQATPLGVSLIISESAAKAFRGQALAAKALTILPVTNLDSLLGK